MGKAAVIIPVYKEFLNHNEELSLRQCFRVFNEIPIIFVSAEGFDPEYLKIIPFAERRHFNKRYFADIAGYNRLMLSIEFYEAFACYEYILIYQLDSFAFRNDLHYWCDKGFDYIGAPWIRDGRLWMHSGNGGFSLRKTAAFIQLLKQKNARYRSIKQLLGSDGSTIRKIKRFPTAVRRYLSSENLVASFCDRPRINEDLFFSIYGGNILEGFHVANPLESIPFSFEVNPEVLFEKNNHLLPFGCHAFEKYSPEFWRKYIPLDAVGVD